MTTTSLGAMDMRTGERRLAARAWVGAASSARANAQIAAAIVAYKLDFYDSVSATAMHSGCVIRSQSLLALLASKSIDASLRKLQFCVFGCNSAQRSARAPAKHRTDSHSCHGPAHLVSLRQSSASPAQRGACTKEHNHGKEDTRPLGHLHMRPGLRAPTNKTKLSEKASSRDQ